MRNSDFIQMHLLTPIDSLKAIEIMIVLVDDVEYTHEFYILNVNTSHIRDV